MKQLFGRQQPLPKTCAFSYDNALLSPLKYLILEVASAIKDPTMIRVTLFYGQALSERLRWAKNVRFKKRTRACRNARFKGIHFAIITLTIAFFNLSGIKIVIIPVRTVFAQCKS